MRIEFKPNLNKIKNAILFCIEQNEGAINKYNFMKILFEADKYHLNKHGRPVTGDTYIAMENGTVPSRAYDVVKQMKQEGHFVFSNEKPDMQKLSESDVEALHAGFRKYAGLTFGQVYELNHKEPAWINTPKNGAIQFELMLEDDEIKKYLEENGFGISV